MDWKETYKSLAYNMEATFSDRKNGSSHVQQMLFNITDLVAEDELCVESAIFLLPKIKYFYNWILHYWEIDENRKLMINQINKFTSVRKGDLASFVNSISWDSGCVPYNWAKISGESGCDISGWTICS